MRRGSVDPVRGLALIALLLAGMGLATLWRHWDRASVADSAEPVVQIVAGLLLLAGLAGTFALPAMSRRRLMREQGSGLTRATARSPVGEGPIIEGEVLAPEPEPRAWRANRD